ncbi:BlaI/MecI/CopY family transcriptional regulator [Erysipelothrix sp. HDW6A]|uniref:BlaI/MecI/CopY family transcriptional regulator n=1 Tax=Erysipelothrix sp. HDW6A TaxID=2714928 RepID=UPI00140BC549|nr:BlaI/MecI/CopY family transcriptional regulator [Erysipelothrix sp. HDW6A]QIK57479.1 BlaI/MecI/CopY family transcriptional regulator [Erysipelothrix sp. HDW6A]
MKTLKSISESELEIMDLLWLKESQYTAKEIQELLSETNDWKITTVQTFLTRLVDKGYLSIEKRHRVNYYTPIITRDEVASMEAKRIVSNLKMSSMSGLITTLIDEDGLTNAEIDELREWLKTK